MMGNVRVEHAGNGAVSMLDCLLSFFNFLDEAQGNLPDCLARHLSETLHRELSASEHELHLIATGRSTHEAN